VARLGTEGLKFAAQCGQRDERCFDELRQIRGRIGVKQVARDDDHGRVVNFTQQTEQFLDGSTGDVRGW
jgi:hypothetical protein